MLKIIDVHASDSPGGEYVVLQNEGLTTVNLRGWALCTQRYLAGDAHGAADETYIFTDDILIKPFVRVVLFTGCGERGWCPTNDGKTAYLLFWNRPYTVWSHASQVHLLHIAATRRVVTPSDRARPEQVAAAAAIQ